MLPSSGLKRLPGGLFGMSLSAPVKVAPPRSVWAPLGVLVSPSRGCSGTLWGRLGDLSARLGALLGRLAGLSGSQEAPKRALEGVTLSVRERDTSQGCVAFRLRSSLGLSLACLEPLFACLGGLKKLPGRVFRVSLSAPVKVTPPRAAWSSPWNPRAALLRLHWGSKRNPTQS